MALYKVGDRVRVHPAVANETNPRTGLKIWYMKKGLVFSTTGNSVTKEMAKLAGKTVVITQVREQYEIKETGDWLNWTDEMFIGFGGCPTEEFE